MQHIFRTLTATTLIALALPACDGVDDGSIPESILLAEESDEPLAADPELDDAPVTEPEPILADLDLMDDPESDAEAPADLELADARDPSAALPDPGSPALELRQAMRLASMGGTTWTKQIDFFGGYDPVAKANTIATTLGAVTLEAWSRPYNFNTHRSVAQMQFKHGAGLPLTRTLSMYVKRKDLSYGIPCVSASTWASGVQTLLGELCLATPTNDWYLTNWHHMAVTVSPSGADLLMEMYIDGAKKGTKLVAGKWSAWAVASTGNMLAFVGKTPVTPTLVAQSESNTEELRMWKVRRLATDISANFRKVLLSGNGLVARYGFNELAEAPKPITARNSVNGKRDGWFKNLATTDTAILNALWVKY